MIVVYAVAAWVVSLLCALSFGVITSEMSEYRSGLSTVVFGFLTAVAMFFVWASGLAIVVSLMVTLLRLLGVSI